MKRLNYARICIEINIEDSLPNAFDIELEDGSCMEILIEYNWVPKKCAVCSVFGHLTKNCKKVSRRVWVPKTSNLPVFPSTSGDWMTVTDHGRDMMTKTSPASKAQHPLPACVSSHGVPSAGGLSCSTNVFDSLHVEDDPDEPNVVCTSNLASTVGIVGRSLEAGPSNIGLLSAIPADSDNPTVCLPPSIASGTSSPASSPSSTPLLARKLKLIDEVEKKLGRKKKKDKKITGSSGNSRGKLSKSSK